MHASLVGASPKLFYEMVDNILVQLESLGENIRINRWIRSKCCICYSDYTRILTAQTSKSNSISLCNIELKVNEANRKYKNISWV